MTSPSLPDIDLARVPTHMAWVAAGTATTAAAAEERAMTELVDAALELGVRWLTVEGPTGAVSSLPGRFADRGIEVRALGATGVTQLAGRAVEGAVPVLTVTVADGYSGRAEIVAAVRALAAASVPPRNVDERALSSRLFAPDMPDPDLVVQTGGDRRVPGLLLWEVAYSEFVFLEVDWPDLRRHHVREAVAEYQRRDRRYGGLVASGGGR